MIKIKSKKFSTKYIFILFFILILIIILFYYKLLIKKHTNEEKYINKSEKEYFEREKIFFEELKDIFKKEFESDIEIKPIIEKRYNIKNKKIYFVNLLGAGGVAIDMYTFGIDDSKKIFVIKFKKNGKYFYPFLLKGSGGAGRYGYEIEFKNKNGKYFINSFGWYAYNSEKDFCKTDVYVYKDEENIFEFDKNLSEEFTKKDCESLCKDIDFNFKNEFFKRICK